MWHAERAPDEDVYALWYPTEGQTHDLLRVQRGERGSVVTVVSAADGSARWRRDVPLGGSSYLVSPIDTADYDGDGFPELVLGSFDLSGEQRQMVFSGRDGTLLWQT